jgi:hypothetical protein
MHRMIESDAWKGLEERRRRHRQEAEEEQELDREEEPLTRRPRHRDTAQADECP